MFLSAALRGISRSLGVGDRASSACTREEKKCDPVEESGEVYEVGWVDRGTLDTIYRLTGVVLIVFVSAKDIALERGLEEIEKGREKIELTASCLRCGINPTLTRRRM